MNKGLQTLIDGFTYQGSVVHCIINYALIILTALPNLVTSLNRIAAYTGKWYWAFITSVLVQVLLWFSVDAVGVSVIWSALAGYNLIFFLKTKTYLKAENKILLIVSLVAALSGIIYYAVTLPAITTAAHLIALLMGIGLFIYTGDSLKQLRRFKSIVYSKFTFLYC